MDPQRRPARSPFFNSEWAVVAHSRPTLRRSKRYSCINMIDKSFIRISMGESEAAKRLSSAMFFAVSVLSPAVFYSFLDINAAGEHLWYSFFGALAFTFVWLVAAHDVKNFAHGRRVFLNPGHLDATVENSQGRWISLAIDAGMILYVAYLSCGQLLKGL